MIVIKNKLVIFFSFFLFLFSIAAIAKIEEGIPKNLHRFMVRPLTLDEINKVTKEEKEELINLREVFLGEKDLSSNVYLKFIETNLFLLGLEDSASSEKTTRNKTAADELDRKISEIKILTDVKLFKTLTALGENELTVAFFPRDNNIMATCSKYGTIKIWNTKDWSVIKELDGSNADHLGFDYTLIFSPDGKFLVLRLGDETIDIWEIKDWSLIKTLGRNNGKNKSFVRVRSTSFGPDVKILVLGLNDGTINIWNVNDWSLIKTLDQKNGGHLNSILSTSVSPDGKFLVSGSADKYIKIWSTQDWSLMKNLDKNNGGHSRAVVSTKFSPDGKFLVSGSSDGTIKIWDATNWSLVKTLDIKNGGHSEIVYSISFSPDGKYLVSGSGDTTIKIWDTQNWSLIKTLDRNNGGDSSIVLTTIFSPDGNFIASSSLGTTIKIWKLFFNGENSDDESDENESN